MSYDCGACCYDCYDGSYSFIDPLNAKNSMIDKPKKMPSIADDESYHENYSFAVVKSQDSASGTSPGGRRPTCRWPNFARSFSSQYSEEGKGMEARSDPSFVVRTNSPGEREDVEDEIENARIVGLPEVEVRSSRS